MARERRTTSDPFNAVAEPRKDGQILSYFWHIERRPCWVYS